MHLFSRVRKVAILAAALAVGSAALVAQPTVAHAATAFRLTTAPAAAMTVVVPGSDASYPLALTFSGDPASSSLHYESYKSDYYDGKAVLIDGLVPASSAYEPTLNSPTTVAPGSAATFQLKLSSYTTPGKYRVTLPITQWNYTTHVVAQITATVDVTVIANPAVTATKSYYDGYGKYSKKSKWSWSYSGPDYLAGASVKVYYKAKGKKKFVKVASSTLNGSGDANFKGKKGAIKKKGVVYFQIGAVPYSGVYNGPTMPLVRR